MKYSVEAHQSQNGRWKVFAKSDTSYQEYVEFEKEVKEAMEESGFPILEQLGVDI